MELKYDNKHLPVFEKVCSNRTFMELKWLLVGDSLGREQRF